MREVNGSVVEVDGVFAQVQTQFGSVILECDDWRIADNRGLKVGDWVSAIGLHRYPRLENGRIIFYIGEDTSVWVNKKHLPIRPDGS